MQAARPDTVRDVLGLEPHRPVRSISLTKTETDEPGKHSRAACGTVAAPKRMSTEKFEPQDWDAAINNHQSDNRNQS